jgi:hypothetical protein
MSVDMEVRYRLGAVAFGGLIAVLGVSTVAQNIPKMPSLNALSLDPISAGSTSGDGLGDFDTRTSANGSFNFKPLAYGLSELALGTGIIGAGLLAARRGR